MGWVLFFDGDCAFCSKSVRWVFQRDPAGRIAFAPLQGRLAAEWGLGSYASDEGTLVVVRESDGARFFRSDALVELVRALGGRWRILALARFIPKFLRDAVYRSIARNRHRLATGSSSCALPDAEWLKRLRE